MAFVGHILRGKDITSDLLLGMVYGMRGKPTVRYSDNIKESSGGKVCFSCTEWHKTEENGEPRCIILNLPLDDDAIAYEYAGFHEKES